MEHEQNPLLPSEGTVLEAQNKLMELMEPREPSKEKSEEQAQEASEPEVETAEQTEQTEPEGEPEEQEAQDSTEEKSEPITEGEEAGFQTLSEVAEAAGLPLEDFLNTIKHETNVDGVKSETTLANLVRSFQVGETQSSRGNELNEAKAQFEAEMKAKNEEVERHFQVAGALITHFENGLKADLEAANLNSLRSEDPAEYAAKHADFQARSNQLEAIKQQGLKAWTEHTQKLREETALSEKERKKEQLAKLREAKPEWADQAKFDKADKELTDYLMSSYGFTQAEVVGFGLTDHRYPLIIQKAMLYDQANNKAKIKQKKVKTLPKLLKPGAKQSKADVDKVALKKKRENFRKGGGKWQDAAGVLMDYIE